MAIPDLTSPGPLGRLAGTAGCELLGNKSVMRGGKWRRKEATSVKSREGWSKRPNRLHRHRDTTVHGKVTTLVSREGCMIHGEARRMSDERSESRSDGGGRVVYILINGDGGIGGRTAIEGEKTILESNEKGMRGGKRRGEAKRGKSVCKAKMYLL
ncbi:hypothetical protein EJ06DRAFT_195137 [Trichodelitschia bisporula]|uniref:Uncharacterized protein n=1 Tax=Trichodelitschia bisporula TaxID=703511 RepID=A0A6G1I7K0_9PEZI|nr:hypothetical protein EJ06DRAFT_195137 [Trichodelitschia bisporula]